ncbi:MAG: hypothetical protein IT495_21760 [Gammaproteobacteria bacterium]|nr:hypothetical protein [Gammaproteobacteria bacterium]
MQLVIDQADRIDTLRYRVSARKTLAQDTVLVTLRVAAQVSLQDVDQPVLLGRIRAALNEVIQAEWRISHIERDADEVGYERVTLKAVARVPHLENHNLAERARRASKEGLAITGPQVDYALPTETVAQAVQDLREELLAGVGRQIEGYTRVTGRAWRLGDIAFGIEAEPEHVRARTSKGAYLSEPVEEPRDGDTLTSAERITLNAAVVLKSVAPR